MTSPSSSPTGPATGRVLRMGIVGVSGARIARAMTAMPNVELVAAADLRPKVRHDFEERYGARTYDSAEGICADPDVDALWISTPNQYHAEHTVLAARSGKHIIIEKPIAISMEETGRMLEAVERAVVSLVCARAQGGLPPAPGAHAGPLCVSDTTHSLARRTEAPDDH